MAIDSKPARFGGSWAAISVAPILLLALTGCSGGTSPAPGGTYAIPGSTSAISGGMSSASCDEWKNSEQRAVVGSVVIPGYDTVDALQARIDVMNAVTPPAEAAESWALWKSHLEQAHTDMVDRKPFAELDWFPASDEVEQAGGVVQDLYLECL